MPGEYERASTTVINAYAGQIASEYITSLQALLRGRGYDGPLLVMQGYGGLLPAEEAAARAVGMLECGPAAGVIGSRHLGRLMEDEDIIACDMGGTTFKVGVIQGGAIDYAREPMVDRYHYVAPKIEVVSIGAGGGSIVALDPATGVPGVGPASAGVRPGPVCYGLGGSEPTLTDVMLLVGYMDPGTFLGGTITLDAEKARQVFTEKIASPLGMSVEDAAIGIYRIAAAQITDLIHEITVERGLDPRDFVLHAFGGSCGLLCGVFGAELGVKRIVVPYTASVNAAFGLLSADIVHEYSVTKTLPVPSPADEINEIYAPMVARAREQLTSEGFAGDAIALDWVHRPAIRPAGARGDDAGRGRRTLGRRCRGPPRCGLRGPLRAQVRPGLCLPRRRNRDDDVPPHRARPGGNTAGRDGRTQRRRPGASVDRPARRLRGDRRWARTGRTSTISSGSCPATSSTARR